MRRFFVFLRRRSCCLFGLTMLMEGGLEEFREFFSSVAILDSSLAGRCLKCFRSVEFGIGGDGTAPLFQ